MKSTEYSAGLNGSTEDEYQALVKALMQQGDSREVAENKATYLVDAANQARINARYLAEQKH